MKRILLILLLMICTCLDDDGNIRTRTSMLETQEYNPITGCCDNITAVKQAKEGVKANVR